MMISLLRLSALLRLSRIESSIHTVAFACCTTLIVENDQFVVFNVRVTENEHKLFGMGLEAIPREDILGPDPPRGTKVPPLKLNFIIISIVN